MRILRRKFLQVSVGAAAVTAMPGWAPAGTDFRPPSAADQAPSLKPRAIDAVRVAKRHAFVKNSPTPSFFEGMLLGNGDVGLCVTVRPDGLGLHIGKNDCWDIRVSDEDYRYLMNESELLKLWELSSAQAKRMGHPKMIDLQSRIPVFRDYADMAEASYRKRWPRPWPCGSVWIHWDPRFVRVKRQALDPADGLLIIELQLGDARRTPLPYALAGRQLDVPEKQLMLYCFVDWDSGLISVTTNDPAPFTSVVFYPYYEKEALLPSPDLTSELRNGFAEVSYAQRLPFTPPTAAVQFPPPSPKDTNFVLCGRVAGSWTLPHPDPISMRGPWLERDLPYAWLASSRPQTFRLDVLVMTPRDHPDNTKRVRDEVHRLSSIPAAKIHKQSAGRWREFWSRSAVQLHDSELEKIWYHNQYFLACCLRKGKIAPGLAGNWITGTVGGSWHDDYHFDYNVEQVYWGVFSSNHADQHYPYIDLIEHLLPAAEARAKNKFGLPGAYFPLSAYPVPSTVDADPAPPWFFLVCDTPWAVQSLWWHYRYTMDEGVLKRAYPALRAAAQFIAAYAKKGADGKYHIQPTLSPENYGLTADFRLNRDCIVDLALSEFLLGAVIEGSRALNMDEEERGHWTEVRANLVPYPQAEGSFGRVWRDVADGPVEWIFNTPNTVAPVFPGEQVGIGLQPELLEIARRTAETIRLEGGNDLVFQPLFRARLGILDFDWFKSQVRYCLMPNGVANDRVRQAGGRYGDQTDFDFMMRMAVWVENFALPAVMNECMMQSYCGVIRLFPNARGLGPARFQNLRAVGAFLLSAAWNGKTVVPPISLLSEKGERARLANPWKRSQLRVIRIKDGVEVKTQTEREIVTFDTRARERYSIEPV
jgi:alpha-L-fucosidase 2